jgi:glycerol-3-phosphate acyltransferase PlsX
MIFRANTSSSDILPIAVDTMGGDRGFEVQVEGAIEAYLEVGASSILVGPKEDLSAKLKSLGGGDKPITVVDAPDVITMDASPARAVRRKPNSSLCVAYRLVNEGKASAVLSAGNSGAMMVAGSMLCGLLPGIERPAIATLLPVAGSDQPNVILDSGANVDCHAQNLVQFAVMGSIYHSSLFDSKEPRVALLSNGSEASKGTDIIRAASMALSTLKSVNYVGYVEGRDATTNAADVIVCDGFVGNVLLKASEGCARLVAEQIKHEAKKRFFSRIGLRLSRAVLREVFINKFDYTAYGGAPLLGLKKLAIVLHGSSDGRAVKNAIKLADSFAQQGMTQRISKAMTRLEEERSLVIDQGILSGVFTKGSSNGAAAESTATVEEEAKKNSGE